MQIALPVYFRKNTNEVTKLANTVITANNFFTRWPKEITINRYPDDITILPSNNTMSLCNHAAAIPKHMPDDQLNTINKNLLY